MATVSAGHQLYLYRLFVVEVGVGRQVTLSRMEEVLAVDDIMPCDLGFETVRELLENLDTFVRLTVFKKGRVYATVLAQPEWDGALERANKDDAQKRPADKGAKSWKRKKGKSALLPIRPRPKNRPQPVEVEPVEAKTNAPAENKPEPVEAEPVADLKPAAAEVASGPVSEQEPELESKPTLEADAESSPVEPEPLVEPEPTAEVEGHPELMADEPAAKPEAELAEKPKPAGVEPAGVEPEPMIESEPEPEPVPVELEAPTPELAAEPDPAASNSQQAHPFSFAEQVHIGNEQLSALYAILPLDVDPIALLDEDWRVARSTASYSQKDGIITFPLRYAHNADGKFVEVSMRRGAPSASGKRWFVTNVAGAQNVGLDGLPVTGSDVSRELAQFAALGPWDDLMHQLNNLRAPGLGPTNNDELQEYLSITFHRVRLENKLVTYANGQKLAFDTGFLTASAQSILMCFDAYESGARLHTDSAATHPGDMAWRFEAFRTAAEAGLDVPAPEPALYITSLSHLVIQAEANVRIKKDLLLAHGQRLADAVDVAIRRVRRDYRLGTPAYDPIRNQLHLIVPLCLENGEQADCALVLAPEDAHNTETEQRFVASAVLSLEHAAACARVVSLELPRWLESH